MEAGAISFLFMRGGASHSSYFIRNDMSRTARRLPKPCSPSPGPAARAIRVIRSCVFVPSTPILSSRHQSLPPTVQCSTPPARTGPATAPIALNSMHVAGSKTDRLVPTGTPRGTIGSIEVSCIDAAMPMVLARADRFSVTGHESEAELDANRDLFARIESIRLKAARRMGMGMGDVSPSVVPKFGLLAPARNGGTICSRYFLPWSCHPSHAITGGICVSAAVLLRAASRPTCSRPRLSPRRPRSSVPPSGSLRLQAEFALRGTELDLKRVGITRTARKLAAGHARLTSGCGPPRGLAGFSGALHNPGRQLRLPAAGRRCIHATPPTPRAGPGVSYFPAIS